MAIRKDKTGRRFGRLLVIELAEKRGHQHYWLCLCDCGREVVVGTCNLATGHTRSCGCLRTRHGQAPNAKRTPTYNSWQNMLQRTTNPKAPVWKWYGGRGITLEDPRWREFDSFYADMGERPDGMTLERVNNERGYCKANCTWATRAEQAQNRRQTTKTHCLRGHARVPSNLTLNSSCKKCGQERARAWRTAVAA